MNTVNLLTAFNLIILTYVVSFTEATFFKKFINTDLIADHEDQYVPTINPDCNCECPRTKYVDVEVPKTQVKYYPISEPKEESESSASNQPSEQPFKPVINREIYKQIGEVIDKLENLTQQGHHQESMSYLKSSSEGQSRPSSAASYGGDRGVLEVDNGASNERSRLEAIYGPGYGQSPSYGQSGGADPSGQSSSHSSVQGSQGEPTDARRVTRQDFDWMNYRDLKYGLPKGSSSFRVPQTSSSTKSLRTSTTSTSTTERPKARSQLREFRRPREQVRGSTEQRFTERPSEQVGSTGSSRPARTYYRTKNVIY